MSVCSRSRRSLDFYSIFVQVVAYYGNMQHYINGYVKYSIT